MLVETIIALLMVAVTVYYWRRQHVFIQMKHDVGTAQSNKTYDVIVVGSGAGGSAAARVASDKGKSVLVIESGSGIVGSMLEAMTFAPDLPKSNVDYGLSTNRPFKEGPSDGLPYPRGHVIGGTSSIDWGMHLAAPSQGKKAYVGYVDTTDKAAKPDTDMTVSVALAATQRCPMSWGFAESAAKVGMNKVLPKANEPSLQSVGVQPIFQRARPDGTRSFLPHALLGTPKPCVDVWCSTRVNKLLTDDSGSRVVGVEVSCNDGKGNFTTKTISCSEGVVVAAGVVFTPQLLRPLVPKATTKWELGDALSIPMIYQAQPGLTNDYCNVQSITNILAWYATRKGNLLNAVCDTGFVADVPDTDGAQVFVMMQTSGGYRHVTFKKWNIAPALGVFKEAVTFHVCVHKLGAGSSTSPSVARVDVESDNTNLERIVMDEAKMARNGDQVRKVLSHGIKLVRELTTVEPFSLLTTGREAVDCSLLADAGLSFDSKLAYKVMYNPKVAEKTKKQGPELSAPLRKMMSEVAEVAQKPEYINAYIHKHARLTGFGVGTSAAVLDDNNRVEGMKNVFVGDVSAISSEVAAQRMGYIAAGSAASASEVGAAAGAAVASL